MTNLGRIRDIVFNANLNAHGAREELRTLFRELDTPPLPFEEAERRILGKLAAFGSDKNPG